MYPVILLILYLPDMTGPERDVSFKGFAVRNSSMQKRPFPGGGGAWRAQHEFVTFQPAVFGKGKGCNV